jgi:hypothetical protein
MCGELNPFFSIFQAKFLKKYQKNRLRGFARHFQISFWQNFAQNRNAAVD